MAPEEAKGQAVNFRADVWAFGAVLYEMVTGARAFTGDSLSDRREGGLCQHVPGEHGPGRQALFTRASP